jgi:hypothetical protein
MPRLHRERIREVIGFAWRVQGTSVLSAGSATAARR